MMGLPMVFLTIISPANIESFIMLIMYPKIESYCDSLGPKSGE
jgi:hypothetical protein